MNPSRLPMLMRLEDHYEWSVDHQLYLEGADLFCVLQYTTEEDHFRATRVADDEFDRYSARLATIRNKPIDATYTLQQQRTEIEALEDKFQSSLTLWSRGRTKARQKWIDKERLALAHILSNVDKDTIRDKVTHKRNPHAGPPLSRSAKEVWDHLGELSSLLTKSHTAVKLTRILSQPMNPTDTLVTYSTQFTKTVKKIKALNIPPEMLYSCMLLAGLPDKYDPLVMLITQMPTNEFTVDNVASRLCDEHSRPTQSFPQAHQLEKRAKQPQQQQQHQPQQRQCKACKLPLPKDYPSNKRFHEKCFKPKSSSGPSADTTQSSSTSGHPTPPAKTTKHVKTVEIQTGAVSMHTSNVSVACLSPGEDPQSRPDSVTLSFSNFDSFCSFLTESARTDDHSSINRLTTLNTDMNGCAHLTIMDSGCNATMTPSIGNLINKSKSNASVSAAFGAKSSTSVKGTLTLPVARHDGPAHKFVMHDVHHVAGLRHTLVSLPQVDLSGFYFVGGGGKLRVVPSDSVYVRSDAAVLLESHLSSSSLLYEVQPFTTPIETDLQAPTGQVDSASHHF